LGQGSTSQQSLEKSANLSFFDFSGDFNFLSTFEDCLFGFTNPAQESEMSSPDHRTRKCSISDIIDVINEEQNLLKNSKFLKDEGYSSSHSSSSSNDQSFSSENISLEANTNYDNNEESGSENIVVVDQISEICSTNNNYNTIIDTSHKTETSHTGSIINTPNLSLSENGNIVIIINHNNETKLVHTTTENLQIILKNNQHTLNTQQLTLKDESNDEKEEVLNETEVKRRGRKRIYFSNTDTERESSKRVRNNVACKKFRQSRTSKIQSLFEQESTLLEKNLNLKEEVAALQRQLVYIKGKLGMASG